MRKRSMLTIFVLLISLIFTGCQREQAVETDAAETEPIPKLTVGLMSAVDAAPFYYAQANNLFIDEGVDVELILFTNAQNRQSALQTGQVDGAMTDLVALITNVGGNIDLRGTLSTDGVFPLLSRVSLFEKDSVSSGVMEISVTNYILEQYLLGSHGVKKVYINEIPARLEAIVSGQLDTGIFPEPFASIGELRGLEKTTYPDIPRESLNLIAFTRKALDEKQEEIRGFHSAYAKAVEMMNFNPGADRDVIMASLPNLPPEIREKIAMPEYQSPRLPSDSFVNEIIAWTEDATSRTWDLAPDDILDRSFTRGR